MKLIRFGEVGKEKPGVLDTNGKRKDVSHLFKDWDRLTFQEFGFTEIIKLIKDIDALPDVPENARWASCVARPGKVICIGLNYSDHAAESGMALPTEPIVFQKGANTVVGPHDNFLFLVKVKKQIGKLSWEL